MLSVDTRLRVSRNNRSQLSIASHRSSRGVRFHFSHFRHTAQSLPRRWSNASRRPMGNVSIASFEPSDWLQNRQVEYKGRGSRVL